jgi:signal transduction histidine kinase
MINIVVKDTGPGIPAEDHALIFEPFRQSHAGMSKGGGTGLGLPIARRLAEAHGGSLDMESVVGQGTTFSVVLPIASPKLLDMTKMGKAS